MMQQEKEILGLNFNSRRPVGPSRDSWRLLLDIRRRWLEQVFLRCGARTRGSKSSTDDETALFPSIYCLERNTSSRPLLRTLVPSLRVRVEICKVTAAKLPGPKSKPLPGHLNNLLNPPRPLILLSCVDMNLLS